MRARARASTFARGALLRNRAEPSARTFYSAAVSVGKSSHVSFTRIRNVSHKYTSRAHTRASNRRDGREIFPSEPNPRPRDANPPLLPSIPSSEPGSARKPQSLIFPYIYSICNGWNVNSFVRTRLLGRDVRALLFFFCSPRRLCLPRHGGIKFSGISAKKSSAKTVYPYSFAELTKTRNSEMSRTYTSIMFHTSGFNGSRKIHVLLRENIHGL